jgi:Ca2+-binding RTX toxin-like protein
MARLFSAVVLALLVPAPAADAAPECFGREATIVGTPGDDSPLNGTPGNDVIHGRGGNDAIYGLGGNDRVCGGPSEHSGDPVTIYGEGLDGGPGDDRVSGGPGPDSLNGVGDDDLLDGGGGRDLTYYNDATGIVIADLAAGTTTGAGGEDELVDVEDLFGSMDFPDDLRGDGGPNWIQGWGNVDLIYGRGGDDVLRGWLGADELRGGADEDVLWGWTGGDDILGGGGNDDLRPDADLEINPVSFGTDNDEVDGGGGRDLLSLEEWIDPVAVDLVAGTLTGQGNDGVAGIEDLTGGDDHDDLAGDDGPNVFAGGPGSDTVAGLGGDDEIDLGEDGGAGSGGEGNDRIVGGSGGGGPGKDVLIGSPGPDGIGGGNGRDVITAKAGADTIESPVSDAVSNGSDVIKAGADFDVVFAPRGRDTIAGGGSLDELRYGGGVPGALVVDLAAGRTTGALEQRHSGFETVFGTGFDDVLRGTDGDNELRGLTGDDRLIGRAGDDTLLGGIGADALIGGFDDDVCDYVAAEGDTFDSCETP